MTTTQPPDLRAIKGRQQKVWSAGDYGKVGVTLIAACAAALLGLMRRSS